MKKSFLLTLVLSVFLILPNSGIAQEVTQVKSFDKVIVSPHIEVVLVEGDEESVKIENAKVSEDKINIKVEGKTLRLYLDGAKTVTKQERVSNDRWKGKRSIYNGTMARATITYRTLQSLSVRGEEIVKCESEIEQKELKLSIYGESKIYFNSITTEDLTVAIYGESYLEINGGQVSRQVYRAYGESEVNTLEMENKSTKITAYGESNFRINVSGRLKVTCYGETEINYQGDPEINKGIVIGEAELRKIG
ncbi:MAG: head GIN domain-containing protein [Maribacter sp.]